MHQLIDQIESIVVYLSHPHQAIIYSCISMWMKLT
jgi:hypothetical protein